jgi:hypothetical protein
MTQRRDLLPAQASRSAALPTRESDVLRLQRVAAVYEKFRQTYSINHTAIFTHAELLSQGSTDHG